MNLDEIQKQKVAAWIEAGLTLSEIQNRLASELGINLRYMEVRFLLDDLKLKPKDTELSPKTGDVDLQKGGAKPGAGASDLRRSAPPPPPKMKEPPPAPGGVSVTVDQITRPGAMVSGKVTFSDGQSADWYLDQLGRLGLASAKQGYRPSPQDLQEFQSELQEELQRLGM